MLNYIIIEVIVNVVAGIILAGLAMKFCMSKRFIKRFAEFNKACKKEQDT